jgi:RNA polymerase-binding transcription factor DksA
LFRQDGTPLLDDLAGLGYRETYTSGTPQEALPPEDNMNKADLEKYRQTLMALRTRLNGDVNHLTSEALRTAGSTPSSAPTHMADVGTDNYEQEFALNLLASEEETLVEVQDALRRIEQGTFGVCEECQSAIPKGRLQALPYARHCVRCASKREQGA